MLTGSSPLNGSSRISRSGPWIVAATNCTFCDMPFDSSSQRFDSTPRRPTRSRASEMRRSRSGPSAPFRRARKRRNGRTFIRLYSPRSSGR